MARFIQFYQQVIPELVDCVGGDQGFRFDQRYSNNTIIMKIINREYPIPSNAVAYAVVAGERLSKTHIVEGPILITKSI